MKTRKVIPRYLVPFRFPWGGMACIYLFGKAVLLPEYMWMNWLLMGVVAFIWAALVMGEKQTNIHDLPKNDNHLNLP